MQKLFITLVVAVVWIDFFPSRNSYLGKCYKIQDGHNFHGNEKREGEILFKIIHTDHNKFTMKFVGLKISKTIIRPVPSNKSAK